MDYKYNNIEKIAFMSNIWNNYKNGIAELNKLLNDENYKDYYLCYFYIGTFYNLLNNIEEAIKFLTLSINLNNNSHWHRAIVYASQNKIKK